MAYQDAQNNNVLPHGRKGYSWNGTNWIANSGDASGYQNTNVINTATIQTELFAAASVAASAQTVSSILTLSGAKWARVMISHGRAGSAAFGTNGTIYRIELSEAATATNKWRAMTTVTAGSAIALTAAASSDVAVGATTVVILSGTAVTRGDIMVWPSGTIEWMEVRAPSGTASFTTTDALDYAHAAATATLISGAEFFTLNVDVRAATRMRVFINNNASGTTQAIYSKIACITSK